MEKVKENTEIKEPVADEDARSNLRVRDTIAALDAQDMPALTAILEGLHASDIADLITYLTPEYRDLFMAGIGGNLAPEVLAELDERIGASLTDKLAPDTLLKAVRQVETDDAVAILDELDDAERQDILAQLPATERLVLERSLELPEDSAGRLIRSNFIAVPPYWTVGQLIDYLRESENPPDDFHEVMVVDPGHKPVGTVRLNKILCAPRADKIENLMSDHLSLIPFDMDREDMARQFERYHLLNAPVVNEEGRLLGVITADEVFEVIAEEAEEDILRLGGVGDEAVTDNVLRVTQRRFPWLLFNLLTAILASIMIAFFDASIEKMVALAVLMPIVASMGGNAAIQTLTVTVRALATRELVAVNAVRIILRELAIGVLNGFLFAGLMAAVGIFWFHDVTLGGVLALAIIISMIAAGLTGILVPMALYRVGIDPAVASTVFVTTVTDVIGFVVFLGLATVILF